MESNNFHESFKDALPKRVKVEELIPDIKPQLPNLEKRDFANTSSSYSEHAYLGLVDNPEVKEFYKDFKGQTVVDLGAGKNLFGYGIAVLSGARAYIGVEPFNFQELSLAFSRMEMGEDLIYRGLQDKYIPFALVEQDMLGFLKRLPPYSVSILMNGIDNAIIPRKIPGNVSYIQATNYAIERVLNPNGAAVTSEGRVHYLELQPEGFERKAFKGSNIFISGLTKFKVKKGE